MEPREYFNVVIYNTKEGKPEGVQLKALSKDEINQYFDYVRKRKLGMQPIGSHNEKVVIPDSVRFFDFSNKTSLIGKNQANHRKSIADRATSLGDFLTACEEYGQEMDMKDLLGYTLFDILNESSSSVDSEPNEYFNLYIETPNKEYSEQEIFDTFGYAVLDKKEINQYIDLLKHKSWGEHIIGKYTLQVTPPITIKIFDLSNVIHKGDDYTREELLKMVPLNPEDEISLFEQFERYGADVTKKLFGEEIDFLLSQLQLDIQLLQRGINAETGEKGSFFSEGNIKAQVKSGSSVKADLTGKISPFIPKKHVKGISDSDVDPAFKVDKIASVFFDHLNDFRKDVSGQMVGIFGQWGRGKTYFIEKVFEQLQSVPKDDQPFELIRFQAWKFQKTPSIWAYLYETFIKQYLDVNGKTRIKRILRLNKTRNGNWYNWWWPLIAFAIGFFWFFVIPFDTKISIGISIVKWLGGLVATVILVYKIVSFLKLFYKPAISLFNSISKIPSFKDVLGVQAEIQKELVFLIETWKQELGNKRFLLFIDDLDRCSENQVIDIVDYLRVMLDDESINEYIIVLVALDEEKLKYAIKEKYKGFKETDKINYIVDEYMDKLFISAIKLFPISPNERQEYVRKLAFKINGEDTPNKQLSPTRAPTPIPEFEEDDKSERENKPEPTPTPELKEITKDLEPIEISLLEQKIKSISGDITPRQIRILVYRYLLAKNIWRKLYDRKEINPDDAIYAIMRYSGLIKHEERNIDPGLIKIARMVVAY